MTQVVLSDAALAELTALNKPVSIVDSSGRDVGTFIPSVIYDAELYRRNPSPLTREERERRLKEGGGKTLAEFWADMRQKHPDKFQ
jgi:hypothetical protein